MNKLYVVGIGPGSIDQMTIKAKTILENSQVIVGYTLYIDMIKECFPNKKFISTPMTKESERVDIAISLAVLGRSVSIISGGDSCVYGLSGLVHEMAQKHDNLEIETLPGVTAALSGGALLGAMLGHDFAVISLSDLLTDWATIEKRLICAANGDFVMSLYNPGSKTRPNHLRRACNILLDILPADTPCAAVRNIDRENEKYKIMSLFELQYYPADMVTTVFIGNSTTKVIKNKLITPRGYKNV